MAMLMMMHKAAQVMTIIVTGMGGGAVAALSMPITRRPATCAAETRLSTRLTTVYTRQQQISSHHRHHHLYQQQVLLTVSQCPSPLWRRAI
jgi:hypothetical protein